MAGVKDWILLDFAKKGKNCSKKILQEYLKNSVFLLLRLRTRLSAGEHCCSCTGVNDSTLIYNSQLFMTLCQQIKMQIFHSYEAVAVLFLTDLHSHSTEPLRTCLNKRSDKFMEGYENLVITYAVPHVFSETFSQWRINYENRKQHPLARRPSCFWALDKYALDMQLIRFGSALMNRLWKDYEKRIFSHDFKSSKTWRWTHLLYLYWIFQSRLKSFESPKVMFVTTFTETTHVLTTRSDRKVLFTILPLPP